MTRKNRDVEAGWKENDILSEQKVETPTARPDSESHFALYLLRGPFYIRIFRLILRPEMTFSVNNSSQADMSHRCGTGEKTHPPNVTS